jgi:hypothetical protein
LKDKTYQLFVVRNGAEASGIWRDGH